MILQKHFEQRILRAPIDDSHLEQPFDESVLDDPAKLAEAGGSNFVGEDNPNDVPDDPDREGSATRKPVAPAKQPDKKDGPVEGEKKPKGEAESEKKDDEKKDEPADKPKGKGVIPVERHEQILQAAREERDAAVRALASAQGGAQVAKTNTEITVLEEKVDKLQEKYDAALIDGDKELAKTVARELRAEERALGDKKTAIAVAIARAEAIETTRFDIARERIEQAYPVLNPDNSDVYDQKVMNEVLELKEAWQLKGYTETDAMQKAVRLILGAAGAAQDASVTVKPRVADDDVKDVGAKRKENAVEKALKTTQPPSTATIGADHDKLGRSRTAKDITKMTDKEFDALSDEDMAAMRGDKRLVEETEDH